MVLELAVDHALRVWNKTFVMVSVGKATMSQQGNFLEAVVSRLRTVNGVTGEK